MTEDEAKTKWCPMVRVGANRRDTNEKEATVNCIGSRCMLWRWNTKYIPPPHSWMQQHPTPEGTTEVSDTEGYCGLSGRP